MKKYKGEKGGAFLGPRIWWRKIQRQKEKKGERKRKRKEGEGGGDRLNEQRTQNFLKFPPEFVQPMFIPPPPPISTCILIVSLRSIQIQQQTFPSNKLSTLPFPSISLHSLMLPMAFGHVLPLIFLIFLLFLPISFAWNAYERPIRLANQDGSFAWELRIEHILTMSALRENDEYSIHDFEPNSMAWLERDKDQLKACLANRTVLAAFDGGNGTKLMGMQRWARESERALPGLIQLHGRHQRLSGVNGQIPGPTLVAVEGAEVFLRIQNRLLLESLTLHLHGLTLQNHWFHGGVAPIQQCPIAVKSDFGFHFRATPAGTHWYHGQFPDGHQSNGLLGALVVLPKGGGGREDRDFVAILQDWPRVGTEEEEEDWTEGIREKELFDGGMGEKAGEEDDGVRAILVNQKGWHDRGEIVQRPSKIPWTRFPVGKDEKIRLRLIHGGYRHPLAVHIEGHQMEVVASDGAELEAKKVDSLIIFPGERFDLRIQTLAHPRHSLYRIVVGLAEQFLSNSPKNSIYGLAELEYDANGAGNGQKVDFSLAKCANRSCTLVGCPFQMAPNSSNATFAVGDGRKFACISLERMKRAKKMEENGEIVEKHVIAIDPRGQTVDGFHFEMPNSTFGPFFLGKVENVLNAANCSNCAAKPCKCFFHKRFAKGKRIQITFVHLNGPENASSSAFLSDLFRQSFSIHLHGIKFDLLKIGRPTLNSDGNAQWNSEMKKCALKEDCKAFFADFPLTGMEMQKDTVLVPFGGFTTISFIADNPGWWLAETQQKGGRGNVKFAFAIGNDWEMAKPPENFPSDCGTFEPGTGVYEQFLAGMSLCAIKSIIHNHTSALLLLTIQYFFLFQFLQ